jgi:hypothetical protein
MASCHVGKTPEQVSRRYERTVDEVTLALNALQVETPCEWDVQVDVAASPAEKAADVATASAGEEAAPEQPQRTLAYQLRRPPPTARHRSLGP